MIISRSIHVAANALFHSSLWLSNIQRILFYLSCRTSLLSSKIDTFHGNLVETHWLKVIGKRPPETGRQFQALFRKSARDACQNTAEMWREWEGGASGKVSWKKWFLTWAWSGRLHREQLWAEGWRELMRYKQEIPFPKFRALFRKRRKSIPPLFLSFFILFYFFNIFIGV